MVEGPPRAITADLAVGVVDSMVDAEGLIDYVVTLYGINLGTDKEERVARFVVMG